MFYRHDLRDVAGNEAFGEWRKAMNKPLIVYSPSFRSGSCYFGEHAEIMRLAFGISADVGEVVYRV